MKSRTYLKICFIAISAIAACYVQAKPNLREINNQILIVQKHLTQTQLKQNHQQAALQQLETSIASTSADLHDINSKIQEKTNEINRLSKISDQYQKTIDNERTALSQNLILTYQLKDRSKLEQLLNQDSTGKYERKLTYYRYLEKYRIQAISNLQQTLILARQNLQTLQQTLQSLSALKQQKTAQLTQMIKLRGSRNALILSIKKKLSSQSEKLNFLTANKEHLEHTLHQLLQSPTRYKSIGKSFEQLKHKMSFPTKGHLMSIFGTNIEKSQLTWKGVIFRAHMNQPVYAVADGKVIFAHWLPSYGLMMILYHGKGYMTLYGRNNILYKKVGDTVQAGDQIAAAGDTGGYQTPALYFAIRHNAQPLDPIKWFAHR